MRIYNSLTDKVEEFKPINEGKVTMYVCGPTVYNYVHIGNMRPVITFDMVYKYLKYLGYDVKYASNYTDINPKITKAAETLGMTEREVANKFIKAYEEDLKNYNCSNIDYRPRVINYLDDIFNFISKLIEKDYAYVVDGDVYFRVSKIKDYGILSNQSIEELISGSRVDIDEKKENPLDFALWRKTTEGETFTSPWGEGIPGWHTECVVMINKLFGDKIDIHAGGVDLKFPHHENEIAQSIALNNNYIANYWMHNGHININNVKMSKSLNNFILAKDFIKEHSANVIKLAFLSTNYRQPLI
jgi:cysteinyl-tRNA synthetase